jgi:hypothetical protein
LDDLAFAIMQEMSKLSYRVTEDDVIRARNQVFLAKSFILVACSIISYVWLTEAE